MKISTRFLENLKVGARFDDFTLVADQPVRYKGDGEAPGPFDYFLASSAMCAAYFVKVYCNARNLALDDIRITQHNIVDPDNRYKQSFKIQVKLPNEISLKDQKGILASIERCTVKRVIQNGIDFEVALQEDEAQALDHQTQTGETLILGKDAPLEVTINKMTKTLKDLGINIEIASWRNQVPHVWSVHIRDADSPICFTNGKGTTKDAALCSALGEYIERISSNYFYNDYYLGANISQEKFVHYPDERWFLSEDHSIPEGLLDETLLKTYNPQGELEAQHLVDANSGLEDRGICAIPFQRQSDQQSVFIPVSILGNLYVSNGMSAGNSQMEARVQALSEIIERAVKNKIISEELCLPDIPQEKLDKFPTIMEGIKKLEEEGFSILVKDASLEAKFPVVCVTLLNPENQGLFASFGAHPKFEVALERSLTELLQGRSFEGMKDTLPPSFNSLAVTEHNNLIDHFIDSVGVVSWKFLGQKPDFTYTSWDHSGDTLAEFETLMSLFSSLGKEVYIRDTQDFNSFACRIIVPGISEIYEVDDLIWDNHNRALRFRSAILSIHTLDEGELESLINDLDDSELDDFMPVGELIGVAFDEASNWGLLTLGELKGLTHLALKNYTSALVYFQMYLGFEDLLPERKTYIRLMETLLHIQLSPTLELENFIPNMEKLFTAELVQIGLKSLRGEIHFHGLCTTDLDLKNLEKHQLLLQSYLKLQKARELRSN